MSSFSSERAVVQDPILRYAEEIGWTILSPAQAITDRGGESGMLLDGVLRRKLIELNPGLISISNVDDVIRRIESVRTSIEGNAEVLAWLRGERTIYSEAEKRQRNVSVVDFDHASQNVFHVTKEWAYTNGQKANRADVVFLLNGIPVAIVEAKAATKEEALDEGFTQLRRYHAETPELVLSTQVFNVSALLDFAYGVTWNLDRKSVFLWKDEDKENYERKVKRFFSRERFLRMLRDWIIVYKRDDELRKIILRQHQTRAVEKVLERALDPAKRRGLVWHTQGSGKTFTMITTAELLLSHPAFKNERPTVLMLVDRNELESQLFTNLSAYGLGYEVASSKKRLDELLRNDTRGLIVSMIHKFDRADEKLSTRSNIFILVDEAHRTTGGDLGNFLVAALPNATMIGYTGTPIDRSAYGQGTFKTFGIDDAPRGYLDKYSIRESIEDGTTLPLHYTLAPNALRVPSEQLEKEFLDLQEAEGVSDIEDLNRILDRAVSLKAFLKAKDRVKRVAAFVAEHFRSTVEPLGYKAFLVGVDREACAHYKRALDEVLSPEESAVVYTSQHNDPPTIAAFQLEDTEEKRLRKAFIKPGASPKILIVTEKLLTGFDAPVLYCMYLDKPMRDHTLLQAIARVNRPYEDSSGVRKPCGFVVDFVGIFENLTKALSFDADEVESAIKNVDVLRAEFTRLMATSAEPYLALCRGTMDDKAAERAIGAFLDKGAREAFYKFFKELENLYEILSPDTFLRPYIDDYARLSDLFRLLRQYFGTRRSLIGDLMRKTESLIREEVAVYGLAGTLPIVKINEETLAALKEERSAKDPSAAKILNMGKSLVAAVSAESVEQPYLIPLGERAESILHNFEDRQVTTADALAELEALFGEFLNARKEQEGLGLPPEVYALHQVLRGSGVPEDRLQLLAETLGKAFERFPEFRENSDQMRKLKAVLYKQLIPVVGKDRMVGVGEKLMRVRQR